MKLALPKIGTQIKSSLKLFSLTTLIFMAFSCAKHQERLQSELSQISSKGGTYKILSPKFADSAVNQNGSTDKPISLVKIQINGAPDACLAYVGDLYRLESVAYQHIPGSTKNFDLRSCNDPNHEALVLWYQVLIKAATDQEAAQYAYVKITKVPDMADPKNAVDFVFMGLLYHSEDALTYDWPWPVAEQKEETFLGFLKRLRSHEIIANSVIDQNLFTKRFLELIVHDVYLPKTTPETFHHFQGPFALTPTINSGDEGWDMLTSTFQTLPGVNGVFQNRMSYCLFSSTDSGFVVTKKVDVHDNNEKPCARLKVIPANPANVDSQYYYEISHSNAL